MVGASLLRDAGCASGEGLTEPALPLFWRETGKPQLRQKRAPASRGMLQRTQFIKQAPTFHPAKCVYRDTFLCAVMSLMHIADFVQ